MNGKQGPKWWEIAPAFAAVLTVIGLPLVGLGWLWSRVGWWAALLAAAALAYAVRAAVRQRRAVLTRRQRQRRWSWTPRLMTMVGGSVAGPTRSRRPERW
ncbi:hypothetical protein [Streptomyces sp. NPDC004721]